MMTESVILASKAAQMAQTDPHGWILSGIAVSVVFCALLILFLLYSLSGGIFTGRFKRMVKGGHRSPDADSAAAIALALERYTSDEDVPAAIAMALHLHLSSGVHDVEPGIITIRRAEDSPWRNKSLTVRKKQS